MTLQKDVSDSQNILIHACCAPCTAYCAEKLETDGYKVSVYFYNPNIHPESEYKLRFEELIKFAENKNYRVIEDNEPAERWFKAVKGLENEKEGKKRCEVCFELRLEKTAMFAKQNSFDGFTTVLTVSPHKNSFLINQTGKKIAEKYNIAFIERNFKKQDGFKKSLELSGKYGFYRQNYCGCIYSRGKKFKNA